MRVLFVTNMWPTPDRPGAGVFVAAQARSLEAAGVTVDMHVIDGHRRFSRYLTDLLAVRRAVARRLPDVVHAHHGLSGWTACWQPRPLVISFCGNDLLGSPVGHGGLTGKSRVAVRVEYDATPHRPCTSTGGVPILRLGAISLAATARKYARRDRIHRPRPIGSCRSVAGRALPRRTPPRRPSREA